MYIKKLGYYREIFKKSTKNRFFSENGYKGENKE